MADGKGGALTELTRQLHQVGELQRRDGTDNATAAAAAAAAGPSGAARRRTRRKAKLGRAGEGEGEGGGGGGEARGRGKAQREAEEAAAAERRRRRRARRRRRRRRRRRGEGGAHRVRGDRQRRARGEPRAGRGVLTLRELAEEAERLKAAGAAAQCRVADAGVRRAGHRARRAVGGGEGLMREREQLKCSWRARTPPPTSSSNGCRWTVTPHI